MLRHLSEQWIIVSKTFHYQTVASSIVYHYHIILVINCCTREERFFPSRSGSLFSLSIPVNRLPSFFSLPMSNNPFDSWLFTAFSLPLTMSLSLYSLAGSRGQAYRPTSPALPMTASSKINKTDTLLLDFCLVPGFAARPPFVPEQRAA
jgi:hypothetical protein